MNITLYHTLYSSFFFFFTLSALFAQPDSVKTKNPKAVISTSYGKIILELYSSSAPQHVANFLKLAKEKFYDGCTFHRIIPGFVIQGGDPNSKDEDKSNDGSGGPGYTVPAEIKLPHKKGALAAARLGDQMNPQRASSGSQFYIACEPLPNLDQLGYTVFGQVIEGMDVVQKIAALPRDPRDNPVEKVTFKVSLLPEKK